MDVTAKVDAYVAAWNEPDADTRAGLLAEVFSPDGTYRDPRSTVNGRDALVEHITAFQQRFPATSMSRSSRVDGYDDVWRFAWAVVREDDSVAVHGIDFVSMVDQEMIRSVTGFFGTLD